MQNRLVITGIPAPIPHLPQSADALRDVVERNGCWVDRFAFLLPPSPPPADAYHDNDEHTSSTGTLDGNVGNIRSESDAIIAAIELHLENLRDSAVDKLDGMMITLDEVSGEEVPASGASAVRERDGTSTVDGSSAVTFQVRASAATAEQSGRLVELCPLEDDAGERIQTLHLPGDIGLTVGRSTCGGGTGAEPWRGGILLANVLCSWASATSTTIGNDVVVIDDDDDDAIHNDNMPTFRAMFHDKEVIELGAGAAGLPSMTLAKLVDDEISVRPSSIIATDGVDEIVNVLEGNVARNNLESSVRVHHLDWNDLQPHIMQSAVDTIIFSDCVYNEEGADALHNAILHLLRPGGFVLGVLPDFRVGLKCFETKMKQGGFVPVDVAIKTIEKAAVNTPEIHLSLINRSGRTNGFLCAGGSDMNYRTILWKDRRDR